MFKRLLLASAVVLAAGAAQASTAVPGNTAVLVDNAAIINSAATPVSYLEYLSGGNGAQGYATGDTWWNLGTSTHDALATADHVWAQYDPSLILGSRVATSSVLAIPAVDHDYGTFEHFEFIVWGANSANPTSWEEGHITAVYTKGVDDSGVDKKADDWSTVWSFSTSYNYFMVTSGDRLVGGSYSPGEGEIDALAVVAVPEPSSYAMLLAGLGVMGALARRRRK